MDAAGIKALIQQTSSYKIEKMMKEMTEYGIIERKRSIEEEADEQMRATGIARGSTQFGCDLYYAVRKSATDEENIILSPISASVVLAMTAVGAKGGTAEEMKKGMGLPARREILVGYKNALGILLGNDCCKLHMANEIFIQEGYRLDDSYIEAL